MRPHAEPPPERATALRDLLRRADARLESVVRGRSMGSALPDGSTVTIDCALHAEPPLGAVVAFPAGHRLIAHRVVAHLRRGGGLLLVTRGDAALLPDRPIALPSLLGVVTHRGGPDGWEPVPGPPTASRLRRSLAWTALGVMRAAARLRLEGALAALLLGAKRLLSIAPRPDSPAPGGEP